MTDSGGSIFDVPFDRLQRLKRGAPLLAKDLNRQIETGNRSVSGVGAPEQVPLDIPIPERVVHPEGIRKLVFVQEKADYLVCEDRSGDVPVTVNVAKKVELQKKFLHGKTIEGLKYEYQDDFSRTVTTVSSGKVELHRITPQYYPDQLILAELIDIGVETEGVAGVEDDPATKDVDETVAEIEPKAVLYAYLADVRSFGGVQT